MSATDPSPTLARYPPYCAPDDALKSRKCRFRTCSAAGARFPDKTRTNQGNPSELRPENAAAISLMMWREQGKDLMSQCFTGTRRSHMRVEIYFFRMA